MDPTPPPSALAAPSALPLVVQVGFAGSRRLLEDTDDPGVDAGRFHAALQRWLGARLHALRADLGLGPHHFLCGVAQVASGADQVFVRACRDRGIDVRVFLPQPRDGYLTALGSGGQPDFAPAERAEAEALLSGPPVIQERVVSDGSDRATRFEDVNLEIARVSDVVVCLLRDDAVGRSGGTGDLLDRARRRGRPALEVRVSVGPDGLPQCAETWHQREAFRRPGLPHDLGAPGGDPLPVPPAVDEYVARLKHLASAQAAWRSRLFKWAAVLIIGTHVLATLLAVSAFEASGGLLLALLAPELVLLALGFTVHQALHRRHAARSWAWSRLVAEVARSVAAFGRTHVHLEHLFSLPLPEPLRPLVRTLNVLHLKRSRVAPATPWTARRDAYLEQRIDGQVRGAQRAYYGEERARAGAWGRIAHGAFLGCSAAAFLATTAKLLATCHLCPGVEDPHGPVGVLLGILAVVLPTLAVGALSLAAALDLEARGHVYGEMVAFLEDRARQLRAAASEREFVRLLLEIESRLLGETASWFSRRFYSGVS